MIGHSPSQIFKDIATSDEDWAAHRSWKRVLPKPKIFLSVAYNLLPVIIWTTAISTGVVCYYKFVQIPHPDAFGLVRTGYLQPFLLSTFAVSLLLVFRTNSAYDRWWEARKQFGAMYNQARVIARQSLTWIHPTEPELAMHIARWSSVLVPSACAYLRDDLSFLEESRSPLMKPSELEWLQTRTQTPIAAALVISSLLKKSASLNVFERMATEQQLSQFDLAVAACERIRRQSIPLAYTRHTTRFMLWFLSFLPFGLTAYCDWATIPVIAGLTFLLYGVENIAIMIEEAMTVLPLELIANGSINSINALIDSQSEGLMIAKSLLVDEKQE